MSKLYRFQSISDISTEMYEIVRRSIPTIIFTDHCFLLSGIAAQTTSKKYNKLNASCDIDTITNVINNNFPYDVTVFISSILVEDDTITISSICDRTITYNSIKNTIEN